MIERLLLIIAIDLYQNQGTATRTMQTSQAPFT